MSSSNTPSKAPLTPSKAASITTTAASSDGDRLLKQLQPALQPGEILLHLLPLCQLTSGGPGPFPRTGTLYMTNFQVLFLSDEDPRNTVVQTPLTALLSVKQKPSDSMLNVTLRTKVCFQFTIGVPAPSKKSQIGDLAQQILSYIPRKASKLFAFSLQEQFRGDPGWSWYDEEAELARVMRQNVKWRVCDLNVAYKLCPTYPRYIAVPAKMKDEDLRRVTKFRSSQRLPVLSFIHPDTSAALVRCSQPLVGIKKSRCFEDERYLFHVRDASPIDAHKELLYVLDARPKANVIANTAMGGGVEDREGYPGISVEFLDIGNIHVMRESFYKVLKVINAMGGIDDDDSNWYSAIDATNWLQHLRAVMRGVARTVHILESGFSVVTHCSDGWDRTSQLTSLPMLLIDSSYRTLQGFAVLIEKEWLSFGHKFAQRAGLAEYSENKDQQSPIFVQFLDCVHQLMYQAPTAFEFNELLLVTLAEEMYSGRFGTFLYICDRQRKEARLSETTRSFWSYVHVNRRKFLNPFFKSVIGTIHPLYNLKHMRLWEGFFLRKHRNANSPQPMTNDRIKGAMISDEREHAARGQEQVELLKQMVRSLDEENAKLRSNPQ